MSYSFTEQSFGKMRGLLYQLALSLACCALLWPGSVALAQTSQEEIPPPTAHDGLVAIQLPDTSKMEAEVRQHILTAQNALAKVLKTSVTPAEKLGEAYGLMGQIYQAYSLYSPARDCYLNAAHLSPKDFRWTYLLAKLFELNGEIEKALSQYQTAVGLRADYLPLYQNLGNIYLQLNRLEEAEVQFRKVLEMDETSAAAQYGLGQVALSKRSFQDAANYFEKVLKLVPGANRVHYSLAMAYRGLNEKEKAQAQLAQSGTVGVRAADPLLEGVQGLVRGARLYIIRGKMALEAGRFTDAAAELRKALAEQPDSVVAHFNLGAALSQTGDLPGAIEQFEETLRLDPNHPDAHYNLGLLLAQMNQHERAITHLQFAVKAVPGDNAGRFLLARELVNVRRLAEAEAGYAKVVEIDPDNEAALLELVKLLLARAQYQEALSLLEKGHARFPQKGLTAASLAYLLAASPRGDLRDGKRALELAQAIYQTTGEVNHGILVALAQAELGRCDEAAGWLQRLAEKAQAEGSAGLVEKIKAELKHYEKGRPCRPAMDQMISGQATPQD